MTKILEQIRKGLAYFEENNFSKAEATFLNLIRMSPTNQQIYGYLIPVLIKQKKFKDALKFSERLINLDKNGELGLIYMGIINYNLMKYSLALNYFERSLIINSKNIDALVNIGVTHRKLGDNAKAKKYLEKSSEINNNKSIVFYNLGSIYEEEADFEKAIMFFEKAIAINEKDYESIHALSLCQLTMQYYKDGLRNYEFRWFKSGFEKYRYQNIDKLETINFISGKKVLIWYEQGLGDTIQFSRYVSLLIDLGGEVTFEVQKPLKSFLSRQFDCEITEEASNKSFDYQCPLMSLPNLFGLNIENIPKLNKYFKCDNQRFDFWKNTLPFSNNKKNIGIAISGNVNHINEYRRRINLEYLMPLTKNFKIFIIQKNLDHKDEILLNKSNDIVFLGKEKQWTDFEDTSAIVQNMDYIVSIDTSLIHLSSSMNKKTFLLLSKPADWRWSHEELNEPNWYNNMTVIRQKNRNNWHEVIEELQAKLI